MTMQMQAPKIGRTYGQISFIMGEWVIEELEPHVSIRLKKLFPKIPIYQVAPFHFKNTPETCSELEWFMIRYPLKISKSDFKLLEKGSETYGNILSELDSILLPAFEPKKIGNIFIYPNKQPRHYQWQMAELVSKKNVSLCADVMGLGKTIIGLATIALNISFGPAAVVVPTHLVGQWKEKAAEFTNLTVHVIKKGTPYNLPKADIYIFKYGLIRGWTEIFAKRFFYTVVFDEIQELRTGTESQRGCAAKIICSNTTVRLGMSGTPIYGYGGEIWNIYNILQEDIIGSNEDFHREWCTPIGNGKYKVNNPDALGQYLREQHLLIRRTKKDVGLEIGKITRIVENVDYEENEVKSFEEIAKKLAVTATTGSFTERGKASMELDMMSRQITGIAKARAVANIVKVLLESGEPVLLSGWHREVYKIWLDVLQPYNPVLYTGTETSQQKDKTKQAFISGETNLMIISNRSGAGLDGLQFRCSTLVVGELDWSPKVHEQLEFRLDRDGQPNPIMVIYPVSDGGSDPVVMDVCGLKNSQADGIVDPDGKKDISYGSDESRIKKLVEYYLNK